MYRYNNTIRYIIIIGLIIYSPLLVSAQLMNGE